MKLSNSLIKQFEGDQKDWGTKVAIQNLLWQLAADIMYLTGVKNIKTTYKK